MCEQVLVSFSKPSGKQFLDVLFLNLYRLGIYLQNNQWARFCPRDKEKNREVVKNKQVVFAGEF